MSCALPRDAGEVFLAESVQHTKCSHPEFLSPTSIRLGSPRTYGCATPGAVSRAETLDYEAFGGHGSLHGTSEFQIRDRVKTLWRLTGKHGKFVNVVKLAIPLALETGP